MTQQTTDWTVSHVAKLFRASETRHGEGLLSQSAYCLVCIWKLENKYAYR